MLPMNFDSLLHRRAVERLRLEYITGWDPEAELHSIPVFASDFPNLKGSGADAEVGGTPTTVVS